MDRRYFARVISPMVHGDVETTIGFLKQKGLLQSLVRCLGCGNKMRWVTCPSTKERYRWKCMMKTCIKYRNTCSARNGSFFENFRSDLRKILHTISFWCKGTSVEEACSETGLSKPIVCTIYKLLRCICRLYFDDNPVRLGGDGVICEVDESMFVYKPKHHRGRAPPRERWVFGIVDTSYTPARGYMEYVERRDAATLLPIITRICR